MIYIAPKKRAIPEATRRAAARAQGATGIGRPAACVYCGAHGLIHWITKSWVYFAGLELDHLIPESKGGQGVPENIVLACRFCNRSKGNRHARVAG